MENTMIHPNDNGQELLQLDGTPATEEARFAHFAFMEIKYKNQRMNEYPSIGDQLDALWKGGQAAEDMLAKVQAVKSKYPKPE
jgi:hypothetical protein